MFTYYDLYFIYIYYDPLKLGFHWGPKPRGSNSPTDVIKFPPGDVFVMEMFMETITRKRVTRKPIRSLPRFNDIEKDANDANVKRVTGM